MHPNESVLHSDGKVVYEARSGGKDAVYFMTPIRSGSDFTASYGLQVIFCDKFTKYLLN